MHRHQHKYQPLRRSYADVLKFGTIDVDTIKAKSIETDHLHTEALAVKSIEADVISTKKMLISQGYRRHLTTNSVSINDDNQHTQNLKHAYKSKILAHDHVHKRSDNKRVYREFNSGTMHQKSKSDVYFHESQAGQFVKDCKCTTFHGRDRTEQCIKDLSRGKDIFNMMNDTTYNFKNGFTKSYFKISDAGDKALLAADFIKVKVVEPKTKSFIYDKGLWYDYVKTGDIIVQKAITDQKIIVALNKYRQMTEANKLIPQLPPNPVIPAGTS